MTVAIILAFSAFFITLVGIRLSIPALRRRVAPDINIVMGKIRPPALEKGGIAVAFALAICLLGAEADYTTVLPIFLLAGVALLGEVTPVKRWVELLVQAAAVTVPLLASPTPVFGDIALPLWVDHGMAGCLWVWFIRLCNRLDKADGVVAVQAIAIGMGLCVIRVLAEAFPDTLSIFTLIVAGCGFGVVWWCWPPARIRLGAVGNAPLGFTAGYLLLLAANAGYGISALILPAFLLGHGVCLLVCPVNMPYVAQADDRRVRYIAGIHMLLMLLAVLSSLDPGMAIFNLAVAYAMVGVILWFFIRAARHER